MRHKRVTMTTETTETTPLLLVQVTQRPRYRNSRLRKTCTSCLGTILIIAVILFLLPVSVVIPGLDFLRDHWPRDGSLPHANWPETQGIPYPSLQHFLTTVPTEDKIREWSQYYTSGPHLAGKNISQAIWTKERWQQFGISDTTLAPYEVYINYPVDHRLALLEKEKGSDKTSVKFEATLEEDVLEEDSTSGLEDRIPTFHGYSASGNVTAQFVYANFGTYEDYDDLIKANISVEGKIALVKYGRCFRGLKVKRAQELGMVGVVIYTDLQEDGEITETNGYKAYPDGPARHPSAVQRGSVQFLTQGPGDPTTPGYPSKPGCSREDPHDFTPSIPSLPISYSEAIPLLKALNGHGPKASDINEHWEGGGLTHKGVEYNIGPSPEETVLNLYNEQEYIINPLWNVIGVIKGSIPDEVIIMGNHRDAWVAGGAGDPNGGSAVLNEIVRSFGEALKEGWKPLRTIVFASWDGEEYGLVGSTEWVEDNLPWLSRANVAYLNLDLAAVGQRFGVNASPLLHKAIYNATAQVLSPNQTVEGQTILDVWGGHINTLGSGSDYTAFQDFAGVASVDYRFDQGPGDAVYQYHSNYDSFHWMEKFGDPGWHYHLAITKVWALTAAYLIETPVLAMNATDYGIDLKKYLDSVKDKVPQSGFNKLDFTDIEDAIFEFQNNAVKFDAYSESLSAELDKTRDLPWWKKWKRIVLYVKIRGANDKYKALERKFLYDKGLDGRSWFKHIIFAPGRWTGYAGATFPSLVESIEDKDLANAEKWCGIIQSKIELASKLLK